MNECEIIINFLVYGEIYCNTLLTLAGMQRSEFTEGLVSSSSHKLQLSNNTYYGGINISNQWEVFI